LLIKQFISVKGWGDARSPKSYFLSSDENGKKYKNVYNEIYLNNRMLYNIIKNNKMIGRIYKITSSQTDKIYIGSTINGLLERLMNHKSQFKNNKKNYCSSKEIVCFSDCKIELIDIIEFENKSELFKLEKTYINTTPNCVNKMFSEKYKMNKSNRITKKQSREKRAQEIHEEIKLMCKQFENQVLEEVKEFMKSASLHRGKDADL